MALEQVSTDHHRNISTRHFLHLKKLICTPQVKQFIALALRYLHLKRNQPFANILIKNIKSLALNFKLFGLLFLEQFGGLGLGTCSLVVEFLRAAEDNWLAKFIKFGKLLLVEIEGGFEFHSFKYFRLVLHAQLLDLTLKFYHIL